MRLSEWSPVVAELRHLAVRLDDVVAAVAAAGRLRTQSRPSLPLPEVAADRLKARKTIARHHRMVRQLIPTEGKED